MHGFAFVLASCKEAMMQKRGVHAKHNLYLEGLRIAFDVVDLCMA